MQRYKQKKIVTKTLLDKNTNSRTHIHTHTHPHAQELNNQIYNNIRVEL